MGRNDAARGREHVESPGDLHVDESRHSSVHFAYPIVQCWPRLARQWAEKKGDHKLERYQIEKNAASIDGLPALRWVEQT